MRQVLRALQAFGWEQGQKPQEEQQKIQVQRQPLLQLLGLEHLERALVLVQVGHSQDQCALLLA